MTAPGGRARRGVMLVELLIGLLLSALVGSLLVKLLVTNNRFTEMVEAGREARGAARAPLNLLTTELRMVNAESGVLAASATSITLRVPFALGLVCSATTGSPGHVTAAFLPVDTTLLAPTLGFNGFALRQFDGSYTYSAVTGGLPAAGSTSVCAGSPANLSLPNGSVSRSLTGNIGVAVLPGTPALLYRVVRYEFASSTTLPGRTALWRRTIGNGGGVTRSEELAVPFATDARFRFFVLNGSTASDAVPGNLANLRGLEVFLPGESEATARGRLGPEQTSLSTAVFFLNRLD